MSGDIHLLPSVCVDGVEMEVFTLSALRNPGDVTVVKYIFQCLVRLSACGDTRVVIVTVQNLPVDVVMLMRTELAARCRATVGARRAVSDCSLVERAFRLP